MSFLQANVYQHFRKDEHPFIDLVLNWMDQVETMYAPVVTEFLNPREAFILATLIGKRDDIKYAHFGGFKDAERTCAIIYPDYYEVKEEDYEVDLYEIHYPTKFANLSHGQILGTLMSTGLKREFIGDIITDGERWQVFLKRSISNYATSQIDKISSFGVRFDKKALQDLLVPIEEWVEESTTVSSLRIDNIISTVYNISRQRAKVIVESKKVKINWTETERPDFVLEYLDIMSVRGLGRVQILDMEGKTKKDKIRLNYRILRK